MEKDRVEDPLFGTLFYHKKLANNEDFDGRDWLCKSPFTYAEVRRNGEVHMCCPNWSPVVIGNVLESTLGEIWQGPRARAQRGSILDGSYGWCNRDTCSPIRNRRLEPRTPERTKQLVDRGSSSFPEVVHFVVDESCNLACPSCRRERLPQLADVERDRGYRVITGVLDHLFAEPHLRYQTLSMDGSGEVFSSELYRKLFESHPVFNRADLWPNLRFRLITNGTMMTPKVQDRHRHIMSRLLQLEVSVDAGDRHSYEQVRLGGRWDLLWENLRHFDDTVLMEHPGTTWRWNNIMQRRNFESLPLLVAKALEFTRRPMINATGVLNWGTWSEAEYLDHAVHLPRHPLHHRYREIRGSAEVVDYLKRYGMG